MSEDREQKNAIFAGTPTSQQTTPTRVSSLDKAKSDFGLEIPVELCPIPSQGKTYPKDSKLHGAETVEIKAMTTKEEDILTSRALIKKGTVVTELIKSCLIDKTIDPLDLLSGDRNALLVSIRITGYGAEYEVEMECPECEAKTPREFNLADLPIKPLEIDPVLPGTNLFEYKLPKCGKVVRFKFMTGRVEEESATIADKKKKLGLKGESGISDALFNAIVSVDGIEDRTKIANFIAAMPARDSLSLREYIKKNEPGLVMKQEVACKACGHAEEVIVPLGVSFLWPTADK